MKEMSCLCAEAEMLVLLRQLQKICKGKLHPCMQAFMTGVQFTSFYSECRL